jgi:hypothetical protein
LPLPGDDDQIIVQYLLGRLPEKEAEHLDELSITDNHFAGRLNDAENDLVDAYVRGELSAEIRQRFRSFYLSSPKRQEKVRFAETLLAHERVVAKKNPAEIAPAWSRQTQPARERSAEARSVGFFPSLPQWGFAAATLLLLLVAASLFVQNRKLSSQVTQIEAERARLAENQQELKQQLQEQRTAGGTVAEAQQSTAGGASNTRKGGAPVARIASFVLAPALRGAGSLAMIAAPAGVKQIEVKLQLEANDFSGYRVTLKDPETNHAVWRSAEIRAQAAGEGKAVSVLLFTRLLRQQNYTFELRGITNRGTSEFIDSYPFRFMVK